MKRLAVSFVLGGALIAGFAANASASDPNSGCPPAYQVWVVGSMTPPYHADSLVDQKGNNDGIVCVRPLNDKTFQYNGQTYQVYNFIDNKVAT
jgi:hypothetical protein